MYKTKTDFQIASMYFNRIKFMTEQEKEVNDIELNDFYDEVDKRRGKMLPSEWLEYNY